jgi:hypothetical protein
LTEDAKILLRKIQKIKLKPDDFNYKNFAVDARKYNSCKL